MEDWGAGSLLSRVWWSPGGVVRWWPLEFSVCCWLLTESIPTGAVKEEEDVGRGEIGGEKEADT